MFYGTVGDNENQPFTKVDQRTEKAKPLAQPGLLNIINANMFDFGPWNSS